MEEIILKATKREKVGKRLSFLRRQGFIPCVIYGETREVYPLKIEKREFLKILHTHRLESSIFGLLIIDGKKSIKKEVMIKEIQYHPVRGDILHVDFYIVSLKKIIRVKVPLLIKGDAIGVKQQGGVLNRLFWELEVECLPKDVPKEIELDISDLKVGDSVYIRDLKIPDGVKILEDPEGIALTILAPKEEVVEVKLEGVEEIKEPELIRREKKEEEE